MTEKKRGGDRPGAGRKKGEPKKAVGTRVRLRFHSQLTNFVKLEEQRLIDLEKTTNL
jgi:hypothetical protein